jgi:hypothetical protein
MGRRAREESEKAVLYLSFGYREHFADNNFGLSKYAQGSATYFGVNAAAGSVKLCRLLRINRFLDEYLGDLPLSRPNHLDGSSTLGASTCFLRLFGAQGSHRVDLGCAPCG